MTKVACWSCGAVGRCNSGCGCRLCANPHDYRAWQRSHGNPAGEMNRRLLEACGQSSFEPVWRHSFLALQTKLALILKRAPVETAKFSPEPKQLLKSAVDYLRQLSDAVDELTQFVKQQEGYCS